MSRYFLLITILLVVSPSWANTPICVEDQSLLKDVRIIYPAPDLAGASMEIMRRTEAETDTIRYPLDSLIRLTSLNYRGMRSIRQYYGDMPAHLIAEIFPRMVLIDKTVVQNAYHISLTSGIRTHSDLLLWQKTSDGLCLAAVYPSVVGIPLYGYPDFLEQSGDTLVVGYEREEEGSINGAYYHLLVRDDAITGLKLTSVKGHAPWVGNPISGVTCRRVTVLLPGPEGLNQIESVHYTTTDENGKPVFCSAKGDSLRLYELTSVYKKPKFKGNFPAKQHMPVGERTRFHLPPNVFLAVEYDGEWCWVPEEDIDIE